MGSPSFPKTSSQRYVIRSNNVRLKVFANLYKVPYKSGWTLQHVIVDFPQHSGDITLIAKKVVIIPLSSNQRFSITKAILKYTETRTGSLSLQTEIPVRINLNPEQKHGIIQRRKERRPFRAYRLDALSTDGVNNRPYWWTSDRRHSTTSNKSPFDSNWS